MVEHVRELKGAGGLQANVGLYSSVVEHLGINLTLTLNLEWMIFLLTQVNGPHLMYSWGTPQGLVTLARVLSLTRVFKEPT